MAGNVAIAVLGFDKLHHVEGPGRLIALHESHREMPLVVDDAGRNYCQGLVPRKPGDIGWAIALPGGAQLRV